MRLIPTSPFSSEFSPSSNLSERTIVSIGHYGSWFISMASPPPRGILGDQAPPYLGGIRSPRVLEEVPQRWRETMPWEAQAAGLPHGWRAHGS